MLLVTDRAKSFICFYLNLVNKGEKNLEDFGLHLKELRKNNKLTQAQLAKKLHVSKATIIRWENNYKMPGIESLIQLAHLYHITLDYIAGIDKRAEIVIDGLTEHQISLLKSIVREFQSTDLKDKNVGLTQRQQGIISDIMLEFNMATPEG